MSKSQTATELTGFGIDVGEIAGLKTQFDVLRFMKQLVPAYGLKSFMVLNLPAPTAQSLSGAAIITNWPAELISLFDREGLLQTSFLLRRLGRSTIPFDFDLEAEASDPAGPDVRDIFGRFGIVRGHCFPVHDQAGGRGALIVGGEGSGLTLQQTMELFYISVHVFERLAMIRKLDVRSGEVLSERELDCLNWTAAGKTSAEIADILGLSEHTVNHYLNRAAKKLDTVNRTQAVARALRIGLIR